MYFIKIDNYEHILDINMFWILLLLPFIETRLLYSNVIASANKLIYKKNEKMSKIEYCYEGLLFSTQSQNIVHNDFAKHNFNMVVYDKELISLYYFDNNNDIRKTTLHCNYEKCNNYSTFLIKKNKYHMTIEHCYNNMIYLSIETRNVEKSFDQFEDLLESGKYSVKYGERFVTIYNLNEVIIKLYVVDEFCDSFDDPIK